MYGYYSVVGIGLNNYPNNRKYVPQYVKIQEHFKQSDQGRLNRYFVRYIVTLLLIMPYHFFLIIAHIFFPDQYHFQMC